MKKSLLVIIFTFLATLAFSLGKMSGTSQDKKISWSITYDGVLNIKGNGDMKNLYNENGVLPFTGRNKFIKKVIIEHGITTVADRAFFNFTNLTSVKLPSTIETIEEYAFGGCRKLETVNLPKNIKTIEEYAFRGCDKLELEEIPGSIQVIEKEAFACCKLTHLKIGYGVKIIKENAFWSCDTETVEIPDTVEKIYAYAFEGCHNLKTVELPDSTIYNKYSFPAGKNGPLVTEITFRKSTLPNKQKTVTYSEEEIKNPAIKTESDFININCDIPVSKLIITNREKSEIIVEVVLNDEGCSPKKKLIILNAEKEPQTFKLYSGSNSLTLNVISEVPNNFVKNLGRNIKFIGKVENR